MFINICPNKKFHIKNVYYNLDIELNLFLALFNELFSSFDPVLTGLMNKILHVKS
jgi:hypothetical protein